MRVWIDQDLCTGDGLCVDHCHDVFVQLEDGIAYVADAGGAMNDPGGSGSLAPIPERHVLDVIHAAESCPGECIFIEVDAPVAQAPRIDVDATHQPVAVVDDEAAA
jgi:ferredoxin